MGGVVVFLYVLLKYSLIKFDLPMSISIHLPTRMAPYRACVIIIISSSKHCALNVSNAQYSSTLKSSVT